MAAMFALYPSREVVFAGKREDLNLQEMVSLLHSSFLSNTISLLYSQDEQGRQLEDMVPFIHDYKQVNGKATAYVCENFTCQAPITELIEFKRALKI